MHLNRGLPRSTVYDLSTVQQPEIRGEISPRIKCSSLRFKCNSLLYLNRGLPGSAVYDLSTDRQQTQFNEGWSPIPEPRLFDALVAEPSQAIRLENKNTMLQLNNM